MKNILFTVLVSFVLVFSAFAAGSGSGGNSGGSGGNSGGSGGSSGGSGGSSGGSGGSSGSSGSGSSGGTGYASNLGVDNVLKEIIFQIEKKENYDDALKDLEVYVYENPENAHAWNFIGFTSRKLGKYDDAELYYNTGLEISPNHEGILSYQGELFLQTERYELALENLEKLTELCNFNCSEKKALSDAIKRYESENNL